MQTPWTSINRAAVAVVALIAGLLWRLSTRRFRMASTCEELLDLFEETYSVREDTAPLTSSNLEGKASESGAAAAAVDLAPNGDKLTAPFARCFRLGREGEKLFVLSELHNQKERIPPSAMRLFVCHT
jgi:hypothetical protein